MIYRIKKGGNYHNQVLAFISESDKWSIAFQVIDNIFEDKITEIGIYPKLNEVSSFKINTDKLTDNLKKLFDKNGWLLPNNKYHNQWKRLAEDLDLKSIENNYLDRFKLEIFDSPKIMLDETNFDLLIEVKAVEPLNSNNEKEHRILESEYELTKLTELPI